MILLGRVYQELMVDVRAANQKLVRRSESMLVRLTGCERDAAREALRAAHGAVMLLNGCNPEEGAQLIEEAGGQLRSALALIRRRSIDAA